MEAALALAGPLLALAQEQEEEKEKEEQEEEELGSEAGLADGSDEEEEEAASGADRRRALLRRRLQGLQDEEVQPTELSNMDVDRRRQPTR